MATPSVLIGPKHRAIQLQILLELSVKDALCFERTCTYSRKYVMSEARPFWLAKLRGLSQACAPDLPVHVNINDLSCEKLRETVRVYNAIIKGHSENTPVPFQLKQIIVPAFPSETPQGGIIVANSIKIAPGGRYLFMSRIHPGKRRSLKFCILDLENEGEIIWTFELAAHYPYKENTERVHAYDFEICRDGSITLALVTIGQDLGIDSFCESSISYIFRLKPNPSGPGLLAETHTSFHHQERLTEFDHSGDVIIYCTTAGDYAAFVSASFYGRFMIIANWQKNQQATFRDLPVEAMHFQILNDHLFYAYNNRRFSLNAISLTQAMEFASVQPSESQENDFKVLKVSSVDLTPVKRGIEREEVRFFNYDPTFMDGQQASKTKISALVFIVDGNGHGLSKKIFKAFRASFDTSSSGSLQWSTADEILFLNPELGFGSEFVSQPSRSGRTLCKFTSRLSDHYALLALNHDGDLMLVRLPDVAWADKVAGYSDSDVLVVVRSVNGNDTVRFLSP